MAREQLGALAHLDTRPTALEVARAALECRCSAEDPHLVQEDTLFDTDSDDSDESEDDLDRVFEETDEALTEGAQTDPLEASSAKEAASEEDEKAAEAGSTSSCTTSPEDAAARAALACAHFAFQAASLSRCAAEAQLRRVLRSQKLYRRRGCAERVRARCSGQRPHPRDRSRENSTFRCFETAVETGVSRLCVTVSRVFWRAYVDLSRVQVGSLDRFSEKGDQCGNVPRSCAQRTGNTHTHRHCLELETRRCGGGRGLELLRARAAGRDPARALSRARRAARYRESARRGRGGDARGQVASETTPPRAPARGLLGRGARARDERHVDQGAEEYVVESARLVEARPLVRRDETRGAHRGAL